MNRGRASTPLIAAVMLMAGCAGGPRVEHDPLVGGGPPLPVPGAAAPVGVASNRGAAVPPVTNPLQLPPPTGATSPAALTVGSVQPGDSGLRIGPPGGSPPLTPSGQDGGGWHAQGVQPGVILKQPEPITDPTVRPIGVIGPASVTPGGAPAAPTSLSWQDEYAQLQAMLTQRNVLFQSLVGPDEKGMWRFDCGVPSPQGGSGDRRYEGSAVGDHGIAAIRAVIDKIDRDQQAAH
jgi:hypothetical protein